METVPIRFGMGASEELGYVLQQHQVKSVMLVTDPYLASLGKASTIQALIEEAGVEVTLYNQCHAEPTDLSFKEALDFQKGKSFDAYVALGGGSVIDTAKAMNLYGTYPAPLLTYINKPIGEGRGVPGPLKPLFALPTTAGTGSESTAVIVLDLLDLKLKTGIADRNLRPTVALIDPLLTLTMPPVVTASTGLDVLSHALESFISRPYSMRPRPQTPAERKPYIGANPIADIFTQKAIELAGKYLRRAYFNSHDLEARAGMMLGSTLAGVGFGNAGVHLPHAMGYPVAGMVRDYIAPGYPSDDVPQVPHGISCIVNAPAAFRFTIPAQPERHAEAARLLGVDTSGMSQQEAAEALPKALIQLMKDIDAPNGLQDLGYTKADIPLLVEGTMKQQRLLVNSPRPVDDKSMVKIFKDAMQYW
ncbi:MAG: iron-containing alcohol dehydrogenase [Deltaproteobacteria bacterium]|nr:MAG: iron-containing alcohol dehydrogenase [Deltaproteobacteria bacterium]